MGVFMVKFTICMANTKISFVLFQICLYIRIWKNEFSFNCSWCYCYQYTTCIPLSFSIKKFVHFLHENGGVLIIKNWQMLKVGQILGFYVADVRTDLVIVIILKWPPVKTNVDVSLWINVKVLTNIAACNKMCVWGMVLRFYPPKSSLTQEFCYQIGRSHSSGRGRLIKKEQIFDVGVYDGHSGCSFMTMSNKYVIHKFLASHSISW